MMKNKYGILVYAFPILFFGYVSYCGLYYGTETNITATVTGKERVNYEKSGKYLIFTDNETFECTDAMFVGKFNSSDMYGNIQKDSTYRFKVVGWRIPFLSSYRNIIKVTIKTK